MTAKMWIGFVILLVVTGISAAVYGIYDENQKLKADNLTLQNNVNLLTSTNQDLNHTIELNAQTAAAIDNANAAIEAMKNDLQHQLKTTTSSIKSELKGLPCYDQTIPPDAIDAVCVMQPSNNACSNHDKNKSDHSSGINAAPAKAN